MTKIKDLIGKRFGKLLVIGKADPYIGKNYTKPQVLCQCDCGNTLSVRKASLTSGNTTSCSYSCGISDKGAHNLVDLVGKTYGRLQVLSRLANTNTGQTQWLCLCTCGNTTEVSGVSLTKGGTKSCGCLRVDTIRKIRLTHGDSGSPEHITWGNMIQRCTNSKAPEFKFYGGKGVLVCGRWRKYENFLEDMGRKPSKDHSIDRKEVTGDYCKDNCRWATKLDQASNKSNNRIITYHKISKSHAQWEDEYGLPKGVISRRLKDGWSVSKALNTPLTVKEFKGKTKGRSGHITNSTTHGMTDTPELNAWYGMKQRCYNPNYVGYMRYGARGITVCDEFLQSFEVFLAEVGIRPSPKHSLDRIDNDKGYDVGNVKWATRIEQASNKSTNRHIEYNGETLTITEWGRRTGIPRITLSNRLKAGWSTCRTLTEPLRGAK